MLQENLNRSECLAMRLSLRLGISLLLCLALATSGCFENEEAEPFYGKVSVPRAQEFRWSDGGLPQVFDPALAAAPPDTDVVRAMYEGLTDYDPRTLKPVAGVATHWEQTEDGRRWTFHLRRDARWSNGEPVTAHDFVNSWRRTLRMRERAPHAKLLGNLEGAQTAAVAPSKVGEGEATQEGAEQRRQAAEPARGDGNGPDAFGAEAVDDYTLSVRLQRPDKNFAALVAHPVFRPVHAVDAAPGEAIFGTELKEFGRELSHAALVTNGAFRLSSRASDGVMLERASTYWDAASVKLERVHFVAKRDTEEALAAYRAGEVDAVTNVPFEPLAVKLLTPYKDFRRGTFGALTYYSFNTTRAPFDDRRVREALAVALDLERLSADTLGGATEPAKKFFPTDVESGGASASGEESTVRGTDEARPLQFDAARARQLLAEAGYPGGANFPRIRLLVNRNDQHRLVAQAVANMWRNVLGVQTEVIVRSWEEYEAMIRAGDYDIARRSMVMQTTDEESNMLALLDLEGDAAGAAAETGGGPRPEEDAPAGTAVPDGSNEGQGAASSSVAGPPTSSPVLTEAQALRELPAIPVYFASSYALVKPYVAGFDANLLDAPSLKYVRIDMGWKPPEKKKIIGVRGVGGR
jgi:ABC-type oligopeptide transport system substrate-binding subunit